MEFQERSIYIVARQLYNIRDFGQKWVKCWVRDAKTDEALLDGVAMVEKDSAGRFRYEYRLPADNTGQGRQLTVTSVVYADSGYVERDPNYEVEEREIIVRDMNSLGRISGGIGYGGGDIDYKKIKKIVEETIEAHEAKKEKEKEIEEKEPEKEDKPIDYDEIAQLLCKYMPKITIDLTPIENKLLTIIMAIETLAEKEGPDYTKTLKLIGEEVLNIKSEVCKSEKYQSILTKNVVKEALKESPDREVKILLEEVLDKLDEING